MAKRTNVELYAQFLEQFPADKLIFRPATESWEYNEKSITKTELCERIAFRLDSSTNKASMLLTQAAQEKKEIAEEDIVAWVKSLENKPADDTELRRFVTLIQRRHTLPIDHEAHVGALKQWIWMVKRHVMERNVVWHVAPIFWSTEGGTGKSTNIKRIIAPFINFTRTVNVDELGEKFSGRLMAATRVAFLDEFAGADKVNAGHFKGLLTGKPIDRRSMHSETGFFAHNRTSCIASSNLPPPHGFIDTTGGRRFWSIHCSGEAMKNGSARMAAFDALDVDAIWSCVHFDDQAPEYAIPLEIREHMAQVRNENNRTRTSLRAFVEDRLQPVAGGRLRFREFQAAYKEYCNETRQVPFRGGYRDLTRQLREMEHQVTHPNNVYFLHDYDLREEQTDLP